MKLVYIAGPITRGNQWQNGRQAADAMLVLMKAGVAVINPMLSMWCGIERQMMEHLPDIDTNTVVPLGPSANAHGGFRELTHTDWLSMDKEIVSRCDAVLRLPGESSGADEEVVHAAAVDVLVFTNINELLAWATLESK